MEPTHLLNITKKFDSQLKKNKNKGLVDAFTERPQGEELKEPEDFKDDEEEEEKGEKKPEQKTGQRSARGKGQQKMYRPKQQ